MLSIETLAPVALESSFDMLLNSHGPSPCSISEIQRQHMSVPLLTCIANHISGLLKSPMSSTNMTWLREHASNPCIQKVPHVGVMRRIRTPVMQAPGSNSRAGLGRRKHLHQCAPVVGARGKGVDGMVISRGLRRSSSPKQGNGFA